MPPRPACCLVIGLFLVASAAGCIEGDEPSEPEPSPAPPAAAPAPTPPVLQEAPADEAERFDTLPWDIIDCFFVYAQANADRAAVEADLPPGFTLPGSGPQVQVGFEANHCVSGSGVDGPVTPGHYASVWVGVVPPEALASEEGAGHFVNFDVVEPDPGRFAWMQERGMNVIEGRCDFETSVTGEHIVVCPIFTLRFGLGGQPLGDDGGAFDQWTPGSTNLTYWRTDWQTDGQSTSPGTVAIQPASRYAAWFETTVAVTTATYGTWSYTDGVLVYPAPPATD